MCYTVYCPNLALVLQDFNKRNEQKIEKYDGWDGKLISNHCRKYCLV